MSHAAAAGVRIDEKIIQNEKSLQSSGREGRIELRESNRRIIRAQRQEDHGLIPFQSLAKKLARRREIRCLFVKLAVRIEQRSDQVQIGQRSPAN